MAIELPKLPYGENGLAPAISKETVEFHYGKHHQAYVTNINNLIKGGNLENLSLEEIIKRAEGGAFNNAAQVWNHTFYWESFKPGGSKPTAAVEKLLAQNFGSVDGFKEKFADAAVKIFGSGWAWLIKESADKLSIFSTSNADTPLKHGKKALLTFDVWEHAYYIDYRNRRPDYIKSLWGIVNWENVEKRFNVQV
jgi:Fe-Mn family superoxide dismutase